MLKGLATCAVRYCDGGSIAAAIRRVAKEVTTQLHVGLARMHFACLVAREGHADWVVSGQPNEDATISHLPEAGL